MASHSIPELGQFVSWLRVIDWVGTLLREPMYVRLLLLAAKLAVAAQIENVGARHLDDGVLHC